ncbi:MAG: hypothetical protein KAG53_05075, partial [Endozoicomonadaceae bacterium]|nr:hypothetical protein [Endozoicomonadaceae bacterium]
TEFYTPTAGRYCIGYAINQPTTLKKTLRTVKKRHGIPNIELIRTVSALLATGKSELGISASTVPFTDRSSQHSFHRKPVSYPAHAQRNSMANEYRSQLVHSIRYCRHDLWPPILEYWSNAIFAT